MHTVNYSKQMGKHLFVIKPFEKYQDWPQYEGLRFLIENQGRNPYAKFHLVSDSEELRSRLHDLGKSPEPTLQQGTLFETIAI